MLGCMIATDYFTSISTSNISLYSAKTSGAIKCLGPYTPSQKDSFWFEFVEHTQLYLLQTCLS